MAEQFTFQQLSRNGTAVDGHEGALASAGQLMDGAGHHLLAGTRFAEDQHVGIGLCHLADEPTHLLDPLALAHQQAQQ